MPVREMSITDTTESVSRNEILTGLIFDELNKLISKSNETLRKKTAEIIFPVLSSKEFSGRS